MQLYGGIEAGGTHFVCDVGTGPDDLTGEAETNERTHSFDTTLNPRDVIDESVDFFRTHPSFASITAIGISCFGPLDLDPKSDTRGFITTTPKRGWPQTRIAGEIADKLGKDVYIDTDVNGAALGELH